MSLAKQRAKYVADYQGLVAFHARRFARTASFDDLMQEGNLGLLKAIDRFDESYNVPFKTFASYWVSAFIRRATEKRGVLTRWTHGGHSEPLPTLSLDAPTGMDNEPLIELLESAEQLADEVAERHEQQAHVRETLSRLKKRLSLMGGLPLAIVEQRLMRDPGATLDELATQFGFSREYVRRTELATRALLSRQLAEPPEDHNPQSRRTP